LSDAKQIKICAMRLSVKRNHETVNVLPTVSMIVLKQKLFLLVKL